MKTYKQTITMKLISGSSNPNLALKISQYLEIPLMDCILDKFKCGETRIEINEPMRGEDVVIIQTGYVPGSDKTPSVNDIVMETLLMIDACRRSMSKSITLVMPLFPYSRQDRKDSSRAPISAAVCAQMFDKMGISRIVCMDLHAPQIQGFFRAPVDNLYSVKLVQSYLNKHFGLADIKIRANHVLVSPDAGATKRTLKFATIMGMKTCMMHKERDYSKPGTVAKSMLLCDDVDSLTGKTAIITDDIIDSGGTFVAAAKTLVANGFRNVIGVITHGYFTADAIDKIIQCTEITDMIVTNSICQEYNQTQWTKKTAGWLASLGVSGSAKFHVIDVSHQLGEAIRRIHEGGSLSDLF